MPPVQRTRVSRSTARHAISDSGPFRRAESVRVGAVRYPSVGIGNGTARLWHCSAVGTARVYCAVRIRCAGASVGAPTPRAVSTADYCEYSRTPCAALQLPQ
jgi:hypothetical protein